MADLGGTCTFCGRKVPLTYRGRAEQEEEEQAAAAAHDSQAGAERSQERPASNGMLLSNQTSAAAGAQTPADKSLFCHGGLTMAKERLHSLQLALQSNSAYIHRWYQQQASS
jgi:hypothetical protein